MHRHPQAVSYGQILRRNGMLLTFAAATAGRLSYAMISLALLLTIHQATGSYAIAGTALGAYGLTSFLMPLKSRLIDRFGLRSVLPWMSTGFTLCVLAIAAVARTDNSAAIPYIALAIGTGFFAPPLGPSMRSLWAAVTPGPDARRRAYSLDGVVEEVLYAVGPLIVAALLLVASSPIAAVVTALLNLAGTLIMITSPAAQRPDRTAARTGSARWTGPLTRPGFAFLLIILLGIGLGGGPLEVALVARANQAARPATVGYLLAALSVGSAIGGLAWGRLIHQHQPRRQLSWLVAFSAAFTLALIPTTNLIMIGALQFGLGLAASPLLVTAYLTADDLAAQDQQREASTWINTVNNIGVALAASAAGVIIDHQGPAAAFSFGAATYLIILITLLAAGTRLHQTRRERNRERLRSRNCKCRRVAGF